MSKEKIISATVLKIFWETFPENVTFKFIEKEQIMLWYFDEVSKFLKRDIAFVEK